jgi:trimethylamine--corrinoid protein Co-methyltransferase
MSDTLPSATRSEIHDRSLTVLSELGMAVEHDGARNELERAGATGDGDVVRLPPDLVESCLDDAPSSFTWHARTPDNDLTVGDDSSTPAVTPGAGARYVLHASGDRERATMEDFERLVRLVHVEDALSCIGYDLCSPERFALAGNPGGFADADPGYELLETLLVGSDKPLVGSARTKANARASIEMARIAAGDHGTDEWRPVVLGRVHPRSPRRWNEPLVNGLFEFANASQPLVVGSGAITGASAPKSLAETVVLANAETLFGVVLTQVVNPGTPVVFSFASTYYDPDTGAVAYGSPSSRLFSACGVEMGDYYDLPTRTSGGVTDAKALGEQSGAESMAKLAAAFDSGADIVFNATGLLDTYETISFEKFAFDCERVRDVQSRSENAAAIVDALASDDFSLDALRETEPGQAFADDRDPKSVPDSVQYRPDLSVRGRYDDWVEAGARSELDRASDRVDALLDEYERPPMDEDIRESLRSYVEEHSDG